MNCEKNLTNVQSLLKHSVPQILQNPQPQKDQLPLPGTLIMWGGGQTPKILSLMAFHPLTFQPLTLVQASKEVGLLLLLQMKRGTMFPFQKIGRSWDALFAIKNHKVTQLTAVTKLGARITLKISSYDWMQNFMNKNFITYVE